MPAAVALGVSAFSGKSGSSGGMSSHGRITVEQVRPAGQVWVTATSL